MFEYIVMIIMVLLIPWIAHLSYNKGIKKGADDFFKLLVTFGFDNKVSAFRELNRLATPGGIVFLGDSITQDYPVSEFFQGQNVYNRGIGGDTTEGILKRLDVSVFELKPKTVVILIGTNDFALLDATPEMVSANIQRIVSLIKAFDPSIHIILESIYPVNPTLDPFTVGKRNLSDIMKTNMILKQFSDVTFLDVYGLLLDQKQGLDPSYTHDGLHVNMKGYQKITDAIQNIL
jgi:lysophospholipase L1-like esterase